MYPWRSQEELGGVFLGHRLTWRRKPKGTTACRESGEYLKTRRVPLCKTRMLRPELYCPKSNLRSGIPAPTGSASVPGAAASRGKVSRPLDPPGRRRLATSQFKGMSGRPTACSDVHHYRNAGSPTPRERQGDGGFIVARARANRAPGEGSQVVTIPRKGGTRDAERRNCPEYHP
jgi:hypothetical protein